jgi:hypothetical protein
VHAHSDRSHSHVVITFYHSDAHEGVNEQGRHDEAENHAGDHADFMTTTPHDPTDHSHLPGENSFHDKSSHFVSLDFAHQAQVVPLGQSRARSERPLVWHNRVAGLSVRPPIRPPQG